MKAGGAERVAHSARVRAESNGGVPWAARTLPVASYGYSRDRAVAARAAIADTAPLTWVLGLFGVLLPAVALLVIVARLTDRVAPGTGTAAALTLGAATLILPFSTLYFSHVLSALLSFAAFALVWNEREGPPRLGRLAVAGLLAGLAIVCEYPLAITAIIVGLYAISRRGGGLIGRGAAYGAGLAAGVAPLIAYQWWAFGSPLHTSYVGAVATTGNSGHDVLGLNDDGVFGITLPRVGDALLLLFSGRGLLTLAPVLVMAIVGVVMIHRCGRRAEARVIAAVAPAYLVYNAGYWLPMGGGSPGPRFLIPVLPFPRARPRAGLAALAGGDARAGRDLSDGDGRGDDQLPDDRYPGPRRMGPAHVRLGHLSAQRAGSRWDRARPGVDPALRRVRGDRPGNRSELAGKRAARRRRPPGARGDRRLGGLRDRAAAPGQAAVR